MRPITKGAKFLLRDVTTLKAEEVKAFWSPGAVRLLAGCAPCQPFSSYANTATVDKAKWCLLREFARLVAECEPDLVTMENVPRLQQATRNKGACAHSSAVNTTWTMPW